MEFSFFVQALSSLISDKNKTSKTRVSLLRLMLIECRNNQKLMEITSWKDTSIEFKYEVLKKLNSDVAKLYYSYTDFSMLGSLWEKISPLITNDSNEESNDISKILSLITRIYAIKLISNLPLQLKHENRSNLQKRLSNLALINMEVIKDIENQLTNVG